MAFMSNIEYEELGKAVGESMRELFPDFLEKVSKDAGDKETVIQKLVNEQVREILKKTDVRKAQWGIDINPVEMVAIEKALWTPAGDNAEFQEIQKINDDVYLLSKTLDVPAHQLRSFTSYQKRWSQLSKAINISTAGEGYEWIPTGFSQTMIEFVELEAVVAKLFYSFMMPTSPFTYPVLLGDGEAYKGGIDTPTDDPAMFRASTPSSGDLTFTAVKIIANYPVQDDAIEDNIVPLLDMMKRSIARAKAKATDNAIINGQLTATIDTGDTIASYDARMCWDGLRYMCLSALKQTGTTWTAALGLALLRALVADMEIFGLNANDVAVLVNTNGKSKLRSLAEVSTDDKFGSAATIHNGEITKIDGMDIVPTQHVKENVNASGIYDGLTTTKTQMLTVYKPGFYRGIRRNFTLEKERVARTGMSYLIATAREHWKAVYDVTDKPMIGWLYNIDK